MERIWVKEGGRGESLWVRGKGEGELERKVEGEREEEREHTHPIFNVSRSAVLKQANDNKIYVV